MNKSVKPIVNYLRELSIVIVGIVVTVGTGLWVNYKNNEKDMHQALRLIKWELEINAKNFDLYAEWIQKSIRYAEYLKANDYKNLNKDSLDYYALTRVSDDSTIDGFGCGYMTISSGTHETFVTNAFEMLKNSGAMQQVADQELLMYIWEAYTQIEGTIRNIDNIFSIKQEEAMKENALRAEGKSINVPMRIFYSTDLSYSIREACRHTSEAIKDA